jgi:putative protease
MLEILAPAGDENSALAAINSGANAIYLGLTAFSARSSAQNFDKEALKKIVERAHLFNVKVYVAMNTLVKDEELQPFLQNMIEAWNIGVDAFIVQDIYLGKYIKQIYPQIKLNLSTQAGVNNVYGAMLAKEYGFERVILARETKLADIKEIAKIIETEVFVQGALCTCFSGQCYLSSFAGGNSGNRGKCKQPCRKLYSLDRKGFEDKSYAISLSDLSVGEDILTLADAGVVSFKIEGRMRRPEYVAAAVNYYKNILNGHVAESDKSALKRTYNRGNYTKGLAFGQDKSFISSAVQGHIGEYLGIVKVVSGKFICLTNVKCAQGDGFKILRGGKEICGATFGGEVKGGFILATNYRLKNGDKVFITTDVQLNKTLLDVQKKRDIIICVEFKEGERAKVTVCGKTYESDFVLQSAKSSPISESDIKKCFDKVDGLPFNLVYDSIKIIGASFVPSSQLNAFRRDIYADVVTRLTQNNNEKVKELLPIPNSDISCKKPHINAKTGVIATNLNKLKADIGILKLDDYGAGKETILSLLSNFDGEKFIFLPPYFTGDDIKNFENNLSLFDGIYCDGYYAVPLAKKHNKKLFAGTGFNIGNSLSLKQIDADYIAISKELTTREARALAKENTFYLTVGDIKVMDLIYCPFGKSCASCDKRNVYTLTDENNRAFPLRRYKTGECRFELFNCASLVSQNNFTGKLFDVTLPSYDGKTDINKIIECASDGEELKKIYKNYTKGHTENPVL